MAACSNVQFSDGIAVEWGLLGMKMNGTSTGCFTIVETKRQLLKHLSMTLFIFLFLDCHREIVNLSIY